MKGDRDAGNMKTPATGEMIVRGEKRTCDMCFVSKKVQKPAYVCMKMIPGDRSTWFDLCEDCFAEHPHRTLDEDDVVLLVNDATT